MIGKHVRPHVEEEQWLEPEPVQIHIMVDQIALALQKKQQNVQTLIAQTVSKLGGQKIFIFDI